jgi:putative copper export protein
MNSILENALVSWPPLLCAALIFGLAAFAQIVVPRNDPNRRHVRGLLTLVRGLATINFIASPMGLLVSASDMAGVPIQAAIPLIPEVMLHTHSGRLWLWRLPASAALLIVAWTPRIGLALPGALAAVLLLLQSLASHAIDKGGVAVMIYFIHEVAASLWIGSLLGLCVYGSPIDELAPRVSRLAGWSVAILLVSGGWCGFVILGLDWDHLFYSIYGRTLISKLAMAGLAMGIGGYNRYRLIPASSWDRLIRNVVAECLILAAVFWLAASLANTPPPH